MSRKIREVIEVSKQRAEGIYSASVYGEKTVNEEYIFTDLRTEVNIGQINVPDAYDFSRSDISAIERLYRYQQAGIRKFDLDFCKTVRRTYSFKIIYDLYYVLWGISKEEKIWNSSETIISPKQNIVRVYPQLRRSSRGRPTVDWERFYHNKDADMEEFSYRIATIGNYIPVPAKEQKILNNYFVERFDKLLLEIQKYLKQKERHESFTDEILVWLNQYIDKKDNLSWEKFVDRNFLKGSFVGNNYNVIEYDGTLKQLSEMIYNRSVVMIQEYDNRTKQISCG